MSRLVLLLVALAASLVQVGVVPAFVFTSAAAPLLPVALLAAWGAVRGTDDLWLALLAVAGILGVLSEERVGWYLLALLPTAVLLLVAQQPGEPKFHRIAHAPITAALGAWAYLALLFLASGRLEALPDTGIEALTAAGTTALLATVFALALWPLRGRPRGLFE